MGYERNGGRDNYRGQYGRDRGEQRYDRYGNPDERGFFDRAGDEVRSWFGDEDAERRRRMDERYDERFDRERGERERGGRYADYALGGYRSPDYPRFSRSNGDEGRGYSPYSTYYPSSGEDRQFTDYGYGVGEATHPGYGDSDRARRFDEYRAVYGGRHRGDRDDDHHGYRSWRDRQIDAFDRDYDEYRRENQSRFESEFGTWRQSRLAQRDQMKQAQEHQEVVGSDGEHVGTVDHVRGDQILLTKTDRDAGGHHHRIPSAWIKTVDDKVHLTKTAAEAKRAWQDADETGGLFGGERKAEDKDRTDLNRSFAGAYDRS